MKVTHHLLSWTAYCAVLLAATATSAQEGERALFKMKQVEANGKTVRVLTPAQPVAAQEPVDGQVIDESIVPAGPGVEGEMQEGAVADQGDGFSPISADGGLCDCDVCGEECCEDCCECCCLCGPPGNCWVRADILGWWTKGMNVPALVTTGPSQAQPGVIGEPGTEVLFGDNPLFERARVGGMVSAGWWFDDCHTWGVQGDYFGLQDLTAGYQATGFEYPYLSRPFIDYTGGTDNGQAVEAVANDDITGQVNVFGKTGFQGAGFDLRRNLCCKTSCCDEGGHNPCNDCDWSAHCCRLDFIGGFRFYRLDDSLGVRELLLVTDDGGIVAQGTTYDLSDNFRTRNEFYGGTLGVVGTIYRGRWSLETTAKVALGNNHSNVTINGSTTTTVPGQAPDTTEGGLLTQASNIGRYSRNDFVAIPQLSAQLGYQWTRCLRTFVGYNILYWANVARAGDQIDTRVDLDQIVGLPGDYPQFNYNDSSFWAQGINGGVEFRW